MLGGNVMEKAFLPPFQDTHSAKGKILTGVFKDQSEKVKRCGALSKFFAAGFEVLHVGINVPNALFIQKMKKFSPHVLILLCQGNMDGVKSLIEAIKNEEIRSMARIVLYGPKIDESARDLVRADACAENEKDLFDIVSEVVAGISRVLDF